MTPFFMAWMMFLALPCPSKKWDDSKKTEMLAAYPFIGLIVGGIWLGVYKLCAVLHLQFVGLALTAVLPWLLTGFMHIDGFMDCADAVLSFKDRVKRIEILKDSHVGSFAVICTVVLGIFTLAAWLQIQYMAKLWAMLLIPVAVRSVISACVLSFEPLKTSGYSGKINDKKSKGCAAFCIALAVICCALGVVLCGLQGIAVITGAVSALVVVLVIRHNLGGMSGDISGSALTIGEACAALALALTVWL